jgi:hypothetical protein
MGYLTGFPSSGMAPITVRLFCVCIAEEGEMNLRQRFVARAPKFAGAANLFDNMWRDRRGKGGERRRASSPSKAKPSAA